MQVGHGAGEDGGIFARAADHGVAEVAQQLAHLARLMVVVDDELLLRCAADGAPPALPRVHGVVVFDGHAIFGFQVYVPDSVRIFASIFAALFQTTLLAYWLYAIQTSSVFVEMCQRFIDLALGANATFRLGITRMIVMLRFTAIFANVP